MVAGSHAPEKDGVPEKVEFHTIDIIALTNFFHEPEGQVANNR